MQFLRSADTYDSSKKYEGEKDDVWNRQQYIFSP